MGKFDSIVPGVVEAAATVADVVEEGVVFVRNHKTEVTIGLTAIGLMGVVFAVARHRGHDSDGEFAEPDLGKYASDNDESLDDILDQAPWDNR